MGCELTKLTRDPPGADLLDRPPPPGDPRIPLTPKQQYCMLASWKGISRAIEHTGVILFIRLFEENEELIGLFERFRSLKSREARVRSLPLAEHAATVMRTLDGTIRALPNVDEFIARAKRAGATHRRVPGFQPHFFWNIEQPFLEAARTTLGDRYTENVRNIYTITIRFVLENMVSGYEAAPPALTPLSDRPNNNNETAT